MNDSQASETGGMSSGWEVVTPDDAARYLAKLHPLNRDLTPGVSQKYGRLMLAGLWDWNSAEGLIFDADGLLTQGRHRLTAIRDNGLTVRMWVTRNASVESFKYLDSGLMRSTAHFITASEEITTNVKELAAVGRMVVLWEARKPWSRNLVPAREEIAAAVHKHPDLHDAAKLAASWPGRRTVAPKQAGFAWWVLSHIDQDEAEIFMNAFRDGTDLEKGDPVLILRERLMSDRERGQYQSVIGRRSESKLLLIFIAWSHYLRRNKIVKLQLPSSVTDETFYSVLGLP